jgi:ABC-type bacteriocin/lantibiotic exporter with double-glycine peptidase domain
LKTRARAGAVTVFAASAVMALAAVGCYTGSSRSITPHEVAADPGWTFVPGVPLIRQNAEMDCGAAAMAMVLARWSLPTTVDQITAVYPARAGHGIKAGDLRDLARAKGLDAFVISGQLSDLTTELSRGHPVLVGVVKPYRDRQLAHYQVVIGIHREKRRILTLDPADGWREDSLEGFAREWIPAHQVTLVVFPKTAMTKTATTTATTTATAGATGTTTAN